MKNIKQKIIYIIICIVAMLLFFLKLSNNDAKTFDIYIQGFLLIMVLILGGVLYFKRNLNSKFKIGLFLVALALFVSYPIYSDYLLHSHDIEFNLMRINGIKSALEIFQIPARIYPLVNNGYGYAVPMLYPELFLYLPAILRLLNTSIEFCYKILLIFINIASVFSMYLAVKNISKSKSAGIVGSIIYATATYRLVTVYTRGAIGETLALSFLPLVIWGLYELCLGDKNKWYIFVIGITCVIQSHILSLISTFIIFAVICLFFIKNIIMQKRYSKFILAFVIIVLVNLWFIVPFLDAYSLDLAVKARPEEEDPGYTFGTHNVIPSQLFNVFDDLSSYRDSNDSYYGIENEMNLSIGLFCLIGVPLCLIYCIKIKDNKSNNLYKMIRILTFLGILFLLLSTSIIPWKDLEESYKIINWLSTTMQFSWRFLGPATVAIVMTMSIIIGEYVDSKYRKKANFIENYRIIFEIGFASIVIFLIITAPYSKQDKYEIAYFNPVPYGEYYLEGTETEKFIEEQYNVSDDWILIDKYSKNGNKIVLDYINHVGNGYIEVPLLYYPGYEAKDENGKKLDISCGNNNVIRIELTEKKSGTITVQYKEKLIYCIADIISLITICVLIIYRIKNSKSLNKKFKKVLH